MHSLLGFDARQQLDVAFSLGEQSVCPRHTFVKFRPCPLIIKMVAAGRLGRKTGHGVYRYEDGKRVPGSGLKASAL